MFEQIGSTDFVPEVTRHLAETYLSLGEWGHASHTVHRSLALAQEGDMRLDEGAARRVLGQVHLSRDELSQAEAEFDMSLHLLQGLGSRYQVGQTLVQLALLYRRQRRPAEAAATLARAAGIFETLGASLDLGQARSLQSRSEPSP
jgi:tetratricopeptide (TPR) repeat protein